MLGDVLQNLARPYNIREFTTGNEILHTIAHTYRRGQCPELGVLVANQKHGTLHHADCTKVFLSSLQPELLLSLVVRLDTFALASGQRINLAESCVVPLDTLPNPTPTEAARARVGSLTVVASKNCLGVTFAPGTAQFFVPIRRGGLCRQWCQPALGHLPEPRAVPDACLASKQRLCSRLLGLSAMGRALGTTGNAANQVWYHAEFEGISPGHLADLERMPWRLAR
jgi:hypothetical protein